MKDKYLQDENVLFIARNFFSYDKAIFDELVVRGAKVDLVYDVPFTRPLLKALLRKMRFFLAPLASRMIEREIAEFQTKCYAYVFVILGEGLTDGFYRRLKLLHPKAKMILYVCSGYCRDLILVIAVKQSPYLFIVQLLMLVYQWLCHSLPHLSLVVNVMFC